MATSYNVYKNNGSSGPVDYTTVVANVSALTYTASALSFPSDTTFAIRATDGTNVETNVDARVRIVLDASGNDITGVPNSVGMISAIANASGSIRVDWVYRTPESGPVPTGFDVWATLGTSVNYAASPNATAVRSIGVSRYSATITGLTGGTQYTIGVRAFNAVGTESNTNSATVFPVTTAPVTVDSLAATPTLTGDGPLPV